MVEQSHGVCSGITLVINDEVPHERHIAVHDVLGGQSGAELVSHMSALVFTAAYKTIDMVIEWVISENIGTCPYSFSEKIKILANHTGLKYPDFLDSDPQLRAVLLDLYRRMVEYRNAITHGRWGIAQAGELHFNFTKKGTLYNLKVPFGTVLDFARWASLGAELLLDPLRQDEHRILSLRFLADRIGALHGNAAFNISAPRFFDVIRRTRQSENGIVTVDLKFIREFVVHAAINAPSTFDLKIEAEIDGQQAVWEIPFAKIPANDKLALDVSWDEFRK